MRKTINFPAADANCGLDPQLFHSERLAGIGQLAAGVAHEINNPIGYVFSNLKTLAGYVHDMLRVIDAIDTAANVDELRQLKQRLEYDYIRGDVEALIAESGEGIDRVKKLISALKDFSYVQEEGFRKADLHHGIETTLNIANNELKYKADVVKAYGELPEVECNASQINQVILNLLMNAAQAMVGFGKITIRTGHEEPWVWLEVEDTGCGMEPAVADRMFEPFFTTKAVGQGTGLGLSLSYNIVEKHNGRIDVFSTPGQGARIRVWLPVEQTAAVDLPGGRYA
jgi:signal transduction histidine kinase